MQKVRLSLLYTKCLPSQQLVKDKFLNKIMRSVIIPMLSLSLLVSPSVTQLRFTMGIGDGSTFYERSVLSSISQFNSKVNEYAQAPRDNWRTYEPKVKEAAKASVDALRACEEDYRKMPSDTLKDKVTKPLSFAAEAVQGAGDMLNAYKDMLDANWKNSDKYFHARGNYEAAQRGPGGTCAGRAISNIREAWNGPNTPDSIADQEANQWGRNGGDPNKYRPDGLPKEY